MTLNQLSASISTALIVASGQIFSRTQQVLQLLDDHSSK